MSLNNARFRCVMMVLIALAVWIIPIALCGCVGFIVGVALLSLFTGLQKDLGSLTGMKEEMPLWAKWFRLAPSIGLVLVLATWPFGKLYADWPWLSLVLGIAIFVMMQTMLAEDHNNKKA